MDGAYLQNSHLPLYNNSSTSLWALLKHSGVTTCERKKRRRTTSFTEWLFDLDAPANVFWLTQSVPLASMLLEATGSPSVWCNGQGSGLLLRRQHRHRVYCPWRWLGSRPAGLLHLGPPRGTSLCRFMRPTSAVIHILSSPLVGVLHAWLGMSSENKHRMKDGKTRDISQRNTMAALSPCQFLSAVSPISS